MGANSYLHKKSELIWNELEWVPSQEQMRQFLSLQSSLSSWNEKVNLTRLISNEDYWIGQVLDSLWPLKNKLKDQSNSISCIDVGSGCGLPGLAIAIAFPNSQVTLVDSIKRKTNCLNEIAKELALTSRINIRNERIETTGQNKDFRGAFDLAMARAVGSAPTVSEYLVPLIKAQGEALIYKGIWTEKEHKILKDSLVTLHAKIKDIKRKHLPMNRGERTIISIIPLKICPEKYPRPIGVPAKRPLAS